MKKYLLHLFLFCLASGASAQNTFEKVIDTLGCRFANSVQQTLDGGYIFCGGSSLNGNDAVIVKLDSTGNIEWAKNYSGPGIEGAINIEQLSDSSYIVNAVYDGGFNAQNWLLRLDENGDTLWTKILSSGTGATEPAGMTTDLNGTFYGLTGYFKPPSMILAAYLIVSLNNGTPIVNKIYPTTFGSIGNAISKTIDYGFVIAGQKGTSLSTSDIYLIKTDFYGDTLWTRTYDHSTADIGEAIEQTADSGFIIGCTSLNTVTSDYSFFLIKTDSTGDTTWTRQYTDVNSQSSEAHSVQQTKDGGYIVAGRIVNGMPLDDDVYLIKTNTTGDTLWTRQYGGNQSDIGYFVRQTRDGGYIICGSTDSNGPVNAYIIKTDSLGNVNSGTGIAELNNPFSFSVFPNPSFGIFTVEAKGIPKDGSSVEIYNISNQCVSACKINNGTAACIDLSDMPNGLYMVMMRTRNKIFSRKIVIAR